MARFYISDTHFCHTNIIKHTDRPFGNIELMNAALVANWNTVVAKDDTVYHIGDFGNWKWIDVEHIYKQLNGSILLIKGSHDHHSVRQHMNWAPYLTLNIGPYHCLLNHRAIWEFRSVENSMVLKQDYDSSFSSEVFKNEEYDFVICGHSHNLWRVDGRNINISVENINYAPLSEENLIKMLFKEEPKAL